MPKTVLVADDSVTIQKVINLTFADEDVVIESVSDGMGAIETAKRIRPDVVLADVCMPGCTGYEVCEAIKNNPDLSHTPVILLVGTFEPFDETEAARVKSDGYLTKPFETLELIRLVHAFISPEVPAQQEAQPHGALPAAAGHRPSISSNSNLVISSKTRESFLGSKMILDLFGAELISRVTATPPSSAVSGAPHAFKDGEAAVSSGSRVRPSSRESVSSNNPAEALQRPPQSPGSQVIPFPGAREAGGETGSTTLTEEMINSIVERVVRRISKDVVRDIVWEVVPEMTEILIRQYLRERNPASEG